MGDAELTVVVLVVSVVVCFPVQLLLCCKVKNLAARLLPVGLLSVATVIFAGLSVGAAGWDSLGFVFLAVFTGLMLVMCGAGWGTWAVVRRIKAKKDGRGG